MRQVGALLSLLPSRGIPDDWSATNAAQANTDATYVQVQSIENGAITALVGTMTQPGGQPNGAGQQGAPSDQSQGSGSAPQGTPPAQPSGDSTQQGNSPQQPSGDNSQQGGQNAPDGQSMGGMMGFTAGTETITFSYNEATVVTKQNGLEEATAAASDIAVGDILAITLSSDNVASAIVIQSAGGGQDVSAQGGQPGARHCVRRPVALQRRFRARASEQRHRVRQL